MLLTSRDIGAVLLTSRDIGAMLLTSRDIGAVLLTSRDIGAMCLVLRSYPLTPGATYIRVFIFYYHIMCHLLNMLNIKCDINQQYLKTVDLHFGKS